MFIDEQKYNAMLPQIDVTTTANQKKQKQKKQKAFVFAKNMHETFAKYSECLIIDRCNLDNQFRINYYRETKI
mgnify:CR=1 FL=1